MEEKPDRQCDGDKCRRRHRPREKEELRWKQTLTFNAFYWSKWGTEGGRRASGRQCGATEGGREGWAMIDWRREREGREGGERKREGETEGGREVVCREETRIISHCSYFCLGRVMEHGGEFTSYKISCASFYILLSLCMLCPVLHFCLCYYKRWHKRYFPPLVLSFFLSFSTLLATCELWHTIWL